MGARASLVRLGLAGLGKFVFLTSAICVGMIIAISGPPTASETRSLGSAVGHVVRRFDSAALHFTFDLCDNVPVAAHAAGLCAKPAVAVADAPAPRREIEVSAVSETLPPSAREILPPDTIDQIARPAQQRSELLGEARPAPLLAHAHAPTMHAPRTHSPRTHSTLAREANAARARSLRATARHSMRELAARRQAVHARAIRARPRRDVAHPHGVRATPIAAPRAPAILSPAHAPPGRPTPAPGNRAPAAPPAAEGAAPAEPPPAPEEHANVAPEEHGPAPPEQSEEQSDKPQPNNPDPDNPVPEDVKL